MWLGHFRLAHDCDAFDNASLIDHFTFRTYRAHFPAHMEPKDYEPIAGALKEDIGEGDVTTDFFVPETLHATARIVARENAVVGGAEAAAEAFRQVDPSLDIQLAHHDGDNIAAGDVIIEVRGLACPILKAERVALNFLQRLCGIATLTRQFVDAVGNHPAKILDTRKTTPGLRALSLVVALIIVSACTTWCS
jgi:nicotinate-nucleotide pyrophosphorylase